MIRFALPLLLIPLPAFAAEQARCDFTLECYEAEPCAATDHQVTFRRMSAIDPILTMQTVSGDLRADMGFDPASGVTLVQAEEPGAVHSFMLSRDGAARYVVMLHDGPALVTYHGQCGDFE